MWGTNILIQCITFMRTWQQYVGGTSIRQITRPHIKYIFIKDLTIGVFYKIRDMFVLIEGKKLGLREDVGK